MTYRYAGRSSEYHPIARIGCGLIVLGILTSCTEGVQATLPPPDAFPTQTPASEIFTPTPEIGQVVEGEAPSRDKILVAYGEAVGAGGPVTYLEIEKVYHSPFLQRRLNERGLAPYLDSENGISQTGFLPDGPRLCFPNMPPQLYNPYVPTGRDDRLFERQFVISYGDGLTDDVRYRAISAVSLEQTAEDVICVSAVVNRRDNQYGAAQGTLFNVLMNRDTGFIYGEFPAVYGVDDRVEVRADSVTGNLQVVVNGSVRWYTGEGMSELAQQLTPTPDPVELAMELPGVERVLDLDDRILAFGAYSDIPVYEYDEETSEWRNFERELGRLITRNIIIPEWMYAQLSLEESRYLRFTDRMGELLPYGYVGFQHGSDAAELHFNPEWIGDRPDVMQEEWITVLFHGRLRGVIPDRSGTSSGEREWVILEIPVEKTDQVTGEQVWTGDSQYYRFCIDTRANPSVYAVEGKNINVYGNRSMSVNKLMETVESLPEGTSIVFGVPYKPKELGIHPNLEAIYERELIETSGSGLAVSLYLDTSYLK